MQKTRVAIFDMDLIAFRSAAATEKKSVEVTHLPTNKKKVFKTRTAFKQYLADNSLQYVKDKYSFVDLQEPEPESHTFNIVNNMVDSIASQVWADRIEGYIGGKNNFRLDLDLPVEYKGSRKTMIRPVNLGITKKFILNKYQGGLIEGIEVDDHINVRYHECVKQGEDPIVITLDKDTNGCVGIKFFNWTAENPEIIEVPVLGNLFLNTSKKTPKVDGLGLKFYCYQLLNGDPSDDYTPKDLHKKRLADVNILNLIKDAKSVHELFSITESKFMEWFPEPISYVTWDGREVTKSYDDIINMYHRCVYMHRVKDDQTTFYDLWEEFR